MSDHRQPGASDAIQEEGRSARKRRAILDAATTVFLERGYPGASMDEIAARATVSKQTVYQHFDDKGSLFSEIVLNTIDEYIDPYYDEVLALRDTGDAEKDLCRLARRLLDMLMQPRLLQLRRLVIGEASRFPELGRTYYDRGPGRAGEALASTLERLADRGLLRSLDPLTAALHFNWLVVSIPVNVAMFTGDDTPFTGPQLRRFADEGVRVFVAAYGAD